MPAEETHTGDTWGKGSWQCHSSRIAFLSPMGIKPTPSPRMKTQLSTPHSLERIAPGAWGQDTYFLPQPRAPQSWACPELSSLCPRCARPPQECTVPACRGRAPPLREPLGPQVRAGLWEP